MLKIVHLIVAGIALLGWAATARGQQLQDNTPVRGIGSPQVGQVFSVPPVAGAPFTATVEFETTQVLSDRTVVTHRSTSFVARDSKGRTRTELRAMSEGPNGPQPETIEAIVFDPETRVRTTLSAKRLTATQAIVKLPVMLAGNAPPTAGGGKVGRVLAQKNDSVEEIGMDYMDGTDVKHFRERRIVSFGDAGNESSVATVYEYWYAPGLKVNLMSKRTDPRTGMQMARLKEIKRVEPNASLFEIPAGYKVIWASVAQKMAH